MRKKRNTIELNYEIRPGVEIELEADVDNYVPARQAPWCRNPDHAAYYDPGDDEYCEFRLFVNIANGRSPIEKLYSEEKVKKIYADLTDRVYSEMRAQRQSDIADSYIEREEARRER